MNPKTQTNNSLREEVFEYVKKKYKSEIEYLWSRSPDSAVFRHDDNNKWYGLVMDVPKSKLGLSGDERVDVLNVKADDLLHHDMLMQQEGYLPGYHMNRKNWISILLDGTVPIEEICDMIDMSYGATASKKNKSRLR